MGQPVVDRYLCNGCGSCVALFPAIFTMRDDKAWVVDYKAAEMVEPELLIASCPKRAISVE